MFVDYPEPFDKQFGCNLELLLTHYHCTVPMVQAKGEVLEGLIVQALNYKARIREEHEVHYDPGSHKQSHDIELARACGNPQLLISVKTGKLTLESLQISGHRLQSYFDPNDWSKLNEYLRCSPKSEAQHEDDEDDVKIPMQYISVPCIKLNERLIYHVYVFNAELLMPNEDAIWTKLKNEDGTDRKVWGHTNAHGVELEIRETMSCQLWWKIPRTLIDPRMLIRI